MSLLDLLLGKPLASDQARAECIGVAAGIPIFGLDALSSAAYGPEAALTLLIPLGAAGIAYMIPISASIIVLLAIVYFSYRQTIQAYPGGGGSYTVARQNLGVSAGLLAAAALMIDYVLTVAVGISAGVGALASAIASLQSHTLTICLGILVLITLINLRGMRDAGLVFMAPTYLFVGTLLAAILIGLIKTFVSGGHPVPVEPLPRITQATALPGAWLILQAFASGCTAMTGVEAVSNGVKAFREPVVSTARRTLTLIILLLIVALAGVLLAIFAGVTDRLIPLYAVGAFLAFTLSQAGMVGHWRRVGGKGATRSMLINGLGAFATGITVIVVLVAKFVEGAWITVLLIPGLLLAMRLVRRHYHAVFLEVRSKTPLELTDTTPPLVILPVQGWNRIVKKALRFAFKISPNIRAIHVDCGQGSEIFRDEWCRFVEQAAMVAGLAAPELVVLPSPFRLVLAPIVDYVLEAERAHPGQQLAVLVPEPAERPRRRPTC